MAKVLLTTVLALIVAVGCAKKPKMNLANLRENGGVTEFPSGTEDGFQANDFVTGGEQPVLPDSGNGNKGGASPNGDWGSMNKPVDVGSVDSAYINNGKAWQQKVYFDYNRYEIKASQRAVLEEIAKYLSENASKALVIEGHCDERGSDEYNRALSERRALAIRDYLNSLGIAIDRMFTISYGEDRPDVQNASTEAEHALNRRGQFLVGDKK